MVSSNSQNLIYNVKISSVGPARATVSGTTHEPNPMDLAMKLHYLKTVYFFTSQACQGLTIPRIKETTFFWLNDYYFACGRFRRSDSTGRPYMKCNDCGARWVEAQCDKSVDEWLEMRDSSLNQLLVYHLPLGPELSFSPSIYFQITKFKCGGISLGLSWAHILGDPFALSEFMNSWSPFLAGLKSNGPFTIPRSPKRLQKSENIREPLSLKRVDPVGDLWVTPNNCKMETFSLYLTASQVSHFLSKIWGQNTIKETPLFESLCALIWQCIAKIRAGREPKIVTICKRDPNYPQNRILSNSQIISSVEADVSIIDSNLQKLTMLLVDRATDERNQIEETVEKDNESLDYIIYGANLTFVNIENANLYEFQCNEQRPRLVYHTIQGVGDEGVVLLLPWPEDYEKFHDKGRVVTVILPEQEVIKLKYELKENGLLLDDDFE